MKEYKYTVLCHEIITDKDSGNTTYINTIDQIAALQFPAAIPNLCLGSFFKSETEKKETAAMQYRIIRPGIEKPEIIDIPKIKMHGRNHRINLKINGFQMESDGDHRIEIYIKNKDKDWQLVDTVIVPVTLRKEDKSLN